MIAKAEKTCYYVIKDNKKEMAKMLFKENYAKAIRRKQADLNLKSYEARRQIGVNAATDRRLREGGEVRTGTFLKALDWLLVD